jgi:hypothetical protein
MKSSKNVLSLRRMAPALAVLSMLAAAGCPKGNDAPGTATGASAAGGASTPLRMNLTVNPADAQNRRSASVKFEASAPMQDGQLMFELPAECRILAGAAVRPVKNLGQGTPISQELSFECPAGTSGQLKATFKGTDPAGQPLEQVTQGAL